MASEWIECKLSDACSAIDYGLTASASDAAVGPRFLRITDIVSGHIDWKTVPYVAADEDTIAKYRLHDGDIVLARTGASTGASSYVKEPPFAVFASYLVRLKAKPEFDPRFLAYYLKSDAFLSFIRAVLGDKSAQPNASASTMTQAPLRTPMSKDEQQTIAHILGMLDDKIELNRRMNETLEAMAQAIFRSWFVDFDPVRAKAEGQWRRGESFPGLPAHLWYLFPSRLVDSELGKIPEGWEVKKLSALCSTQYEFTASAVDEPIGPMFLRLTDINKRNWIEWGDVPHCTIDPDLRASYALEVGDLVVARMADPGKSAIIEEEIDAVFASYLVRLKTPSLAHSYYVYGFLKSELYADYAEGAKSGSVQANMNAKVIVGASLVVPPKVVMEQFLRAVLPLRQRLVANVRESVTLASLRDTLLPKLISGELRVKDAERFSGRAHA
jgi:type I restriction enzyme, S subunit